MVGFRRRSAVGVIVEHFYLVDGAADSTEAHRAAARMAEFASEGAGRRAGEPDVQRVQVQRVIPDPLGRVRLSAPVPAAMATPSAPSACPATSAAEVAR
ncbi:hypothetical protein SBI_09569 [Streptomyces bingchenggensis BCW-1]|uniref:Uncharacterized protein n=2 Tax=Streptomyces TaxID=1883 RepID=D7C9H5_STRBB|nr:hypothetical protein SBI_09569 [Streptomyces bingchenggensis BCW-1]